MTEGWTEGSPLIREGESIQIYVNQGMRDGIVLFVREDIGQALLEYEMPNGSSTLWIIDLYGNKIRNVSYPSLSLTWLGLMAEAGVWWICNPQQSSARYRHMSVGELWELKLKEKEDFVTAKNQIRNEFASGRRSAVIRAGDMTVQKEKGK